MATMNATRPTLSGGQGGQNGLGGQGGQTGFGGQGPQGGQGGAGPQQVGAGGQGGAQGGGQGGGHGPEGHGAGGPPPIESVSEWVDDVLTDGGFTASTTAATRIDGIADALDTVVQAGGTELPQEYVRHLESTIGDLRNIAQNGDRTLGDGTADTMFPTAMAKAVHKVEEFLEYEGDNLSAETTTRLESVLDSMNTIYADGTVSTAEQATLTTVADDLCDVLIEDFTKLSTTGLTALTEHASDLHTLADTGFLALDDAQRAILTEAQTALDAMDLDDPVQSEVHEVVDDLRFGLGGELLGLAMPARTVGLVGQSGNTDASADWAVA